MRDVQFVFRKAWMGNWLDAAIGVLSLGPYSHVDIVFPERDCFFETSFDRGTRLLGGSHDSFAHPLAWSSVTVTLTNKAHDGILAFCEREQGKEYDWWGVLGHAIPCVKSTRGKWTCTEVVVGALREIDWLKEPRRRRYTPWGLKRRIVREWRERNS